MTQIKKILDKQGDEVFIRTSTKAVVDGNGYTVESRLQAMQDEINQAQLEVGAVPSDLAPTESSSNWVTSGGVFNAIKSVQDDLKTIFFSLGAYAFPDGKPNLDFDDIITYSVAKTIGTGLSATGGDTDVALGDTLEITIAITNNLYIVDDDSVVVTMGGSPVAGAWNASTMKVTIGTVTGNVVINVPSLTYVQRGLVLHLDGKNGRSVAHRWDSLVNYNNNPLYFKLENCDESNSDYVAGNGTNSKGTAFSDSALTTPVTLLDVGALQGTIEAAYNGAEYNANGNLGIMHNGIGSGNRLCLMSYTGTNGPLLIEATVPALTTNGTAARNSTGTKDLLESGGSVSCMFGSFKVNGTELEISGTAAQNTDSNSRLSIFWRKTTNENFFKLNLFALRVYSVQLTDDERAQNLAIDQKRFNL